RAIPGSGAGSTWKRRGNRPTRRRGRAAWRDRPPRRCGPAGERSAPRSGNGSRRVSPGGAPRSEGEEATVCRTTRAGREAAPRSARRSNVPLLGTVCFTSRGGEYLHPFQGEPWQSIRSGHINELGRRGEGETGRLVPEEDVEDAAEVV